MRRDLYGAARWASYASTLTTTASPRQAIGRREEVTGRLGYRLRDGWKAGQGRNPKEFSHLQEAIRSPLSQNLSKPFQAQKLPFFIALKRRIRYVFSVTWSADWLLRRFSKWNCCAPIFPARDCRCAVNSCPASITIIRADSGGSRLSRGLVCLCDSRGGGEPYLPAARWWGALADWVPRNRFSQARHEDGQA